MSNTFAYSCECDDRACDRTFSLLPDVYGRLSARGVVRHVDCACVRGLNVLDAYGDAIAVPTAVRRRARASVGAGASGARVGSGVRVW